MVERLPANTAGEVLAKYDVEMLALAWEETKTACIVTSELGASTAIGDPYRPSSRHRRCRCRLG
jgi:hypothetical protein